MRKLLVLLSLIALPAVAQTSATGTWTGTYNYSVQVSSCSNKTYTASGNASLTLLQTGTSASGRMDLANFLAFSGSSCTATTAETTTVVVGTAIGASVALEIPNDPSGTQFTGSISGNTMTLQWSDANGGTGTVTLTQTSGAPSSDFTGAWSGTYSLTDQCSNGVKLAYTGPLTVSLTQSGANAAGVVTMQNVPLYDQNCSKIAILTQSMSIAGSVSGSTLNGAVFDPSGLFDFPVSATIAGANISGTVAGVSNTNTNGTFTLTRSSTAPPAQTFGGTYDGTYTESDNLAGRCINVGAITYSGNATLTVNQAGNDVSGWLAFHDAEDVQSDGFGNCVPVSIGDEILPVYGTLANGVLTTNAPIAGGATLTFNFSGNSVTAQMQDSNGDVAQMTGTKSSNAAQLAINLFSATPSSIVAGAPVTLAWSTSNATSVSIDNNIGAQSLSGTVTVFPTKTTTYTLTATGASGTQTAQVTVNVAAQTPRRRIVKP